jgi:hypothetical protein
VSSLVRTCAVCAALGCARASDQSSAEPAARSDAGAAPDQPADTVHGLACPAPPSCDDTAPHLPVLLHAAALGDDVRFLAIPSTQRLPDSAVYVW